MTVTDPKAAAVLTDPVKLEQFKPFIGRAVSVSEAAEQEGVKLNTMYHWIKRFESLDLIHVVSEQSRNGRAIKRYQAVADTFFVPFGLSPFSTLEEALATLDKRWEHELRRRVVQARQQVVDSWGYLISRHTSGTLMLESAEAGQAVDFLAEAAPAVLSSWSDLVYLTDEEAKALQRYLRELVEPAEPAPGKRRYVLRLGLVPSHKSI